MTELKTINEKLKQESLKSKGDLDSQNAELKTLNDQLEQNISE